MYCVRFAREAIKANEIASRKQLKIMATEFAAGTFDEWVGSIRRGRGTWRDDG
jgi:hypothetical protein